MLQYTDFARTLDERLANPTMEDTSTDVPVLLNSAAPVVKVTVCGMDELMKKAMQDTQVAMKQAKQDHNTAVSVA